MTYVETNDISRQYNDKFIMYSDRACGIILSSLTASRRQYQNKPRPSDLSHLIPPKNYWIHSRGAKIQKIKRIDHSKCNVRASKNAEQAFSTQWYLYICNGLFFLFSVCWLHVNEFNSLWGDKGKKSEDYYLLGRYLCHGILFTRSHITVAMLSPLCWLFSSFTDDKPFFFSTR